MLAGPSALADERLPPPVDEEVRMSELRTHTLHDPVRWKYHAIGNDHLNGVYPPRHPWL